MQFYFLAPLILVPLSLSFSNKKMNYLSKAIASALLLCHLILNIYEAIRFNPDKPIYDYKELL